jgi:hypothetical protein
MKKLLLIPFFLLLSGCPQPNYVEVFNNTAGDIWILSATAKSTFITSGKTRRLTESQFLYHSMSEDRRFPAMIWISDEVRQWEYDLTAELLLKVRPRPDVVTRVQVQSGEEIVILDRGSKYSAYHMPAGLTLRGRRT